tara:strand:+ start:3724 stop:4809 length:1086 start_codon:yes stop_codon:yes gene_type:complete
MAYEMPIRLRHLLVLIATITVWHGPAMAAPESIERLSTATSLNDSQIAQINEYATYWVEQLGNKDSETVREARNKLTRPLRVISGRPASLMFRTTYGKALIPKLREIINGDSRYHAVNAIQVATALSTPSALSLLEEHIHIDDESRPEIRLWSVIGVSRFINDETIRFDKLRGILRTLAGSAQVETNPLVLQRAMETLNQAVLNGRPKNLGGEELRATAIQFEMEVLDEQIKSLEEGKAASMMVKALQPSLILIRNQYIDPNLQQQQRAIGLQSAPLMGRVYKVIIVNNDKLRADPELSRSVPMLINSMENTLKLIDSNIRSSQTSPDTTDGGVSWSKGDLSALERSQDRWKSILTAAPYK